MSKLPVPPVVNVLSVAVQAGVPVLLWGAPGTGKSSLIRQLGAALELPVEVVIAAIREPSDFAGLPVVVDGEVRFAPPAWARRLAAAGRGLLFLDEISTAPPAVQAALLRVVLERVVGDLELPAGVAVVASANPVEQAAGGWELSAPLANRFLHLEWRPSPKNWVAGLQAGWELWEPPAVPADWENELPAAREAVARFITARPKALVECPADAQQRSGPWPSPRTWEMAARLLAAARAARLRSADIEVIIKGLVGRGRAMEFFEVQRTGELWDAAAALQSPEGYEYPEEPDLLEGLLDDVCSRALQKDDWSRAWRVLAVVGQKFGRDRVAHHALQLLEQGAGEHGIPREAARILGPAAADAAAAAGGGA